MCACVQLGELVNLPFKAVALALANTSKLASPQKTVFLLYPGSDWVLSFGTLPVSPQVCDELFVECS